MLTFSGQDDPDPHLFAQEVRNCAGASVTLGIWSAKVVSIRIMLILNKLEDASVDTGDDGMFM